MADGLVVNDGKLDADTTMKGQNLGSVVYLDASVDKLLLGADVASVLDARATCRQPVSDAAIPVLEDKNGVRNYRRRKAFAPRIAKSGQRIREASGVRKPCLRSISRRHASGK